MSKRNVTVRHEPSTIEKVEYVAEKVGVDQSVIWRRLVTSTESIETIYEEWARVESLVDRIPAMKNRGLEEKEDDLLERHYDLSEAEEHLLDEVQTELRKRTQDETEAAVAA